jgi:methylmalonyl-CoA mutase cobalamin-binding subunit
MRAAADEDADAIVLGTYNGNAIDLGERLSAARDRAGWGGQIFMGGVLNQDTGGALPVDARPRLAQVGVQCVERVEDLIGLLAALSARS